MTRLVRSGVGAAGLLAFLQALAAARAAPQPAAAPDFTRDIQPILAVSCVRCHGGALAQGKLRLDTREGLLQGGATGAVFAPGDGRNSLLYQRLVVDDPQKRMPWLSEPLTPAQIETVRRWIEAGRWFLRARMQHAPYEQRIHHCVPLALSFAEESSSPAPALARRRS